MFYFILFWIFVFLFFFTESSSSSSAPSPTPSNPTLAQPPEDPPVQEPAQIPEDTACEEQDSLLTKSPVVIAETLLSKMDKEQASRQPNTTQFDVKIGDGMDIAIHGENGELVLGGWLYIYIVQDSDSARDFFK